MSKTAIVYYSYSGNTKKIAEMIQSKIGGDLYRIEPVTPYSEDFDTVVKQAKREIESGFKPKIQTINLPLEQYDTLVIGTPVWWYTMAPAVASFLSAVDLSGKKIIPYATNAGWLGETFGDIKKLCSGSHAEKGMNVKFSETTLKTAVKDIENWIATA
jgi:flavodoxin